MLTAVNCGDDTDCTAATVGAFLGILRGTAGIPADWAEYIGDEIITISLDRSWQRLDEIRTCSDLTKRVFNQIPAVLIANGYYVDYAEEGFLVEPNNYKPFRTIPLPRPMERAQYNYDAWENSTMSIRVEYDRLPKIRPGDEIQVRLVFFNKMPAKQKFLGIRGILPEGIRSKDLNGIHYMDRKRPWGDTYTFTVKVDENAVLQPENHILIEARCAGRPTCALFKVQLFA